MAEAAAPQSAIWGRLLQDNLAGPANDIASFKSDNLWFLGVFMEFLGTFVSVAGKQMFRHAAVSGQRRFYVYGFIGVVLIYPALDIVALEFAAQTVISTVAGMVVVWNILLAPCTLGEDMTTKRISSAVVIMLGIVGAGSFGPHFEAERTPDQELQQLFTTGGAIFYYLLLFSFLAIGYGVVLPNEEWMPKQSLRNGALQGGCALAGSINGNAFVVKAAILFVQHGQWGSFWLYFLWALTCTYHLFALSMLALALRSHEALHVVTIYEAVSIAVGALSGNLVLAEYQGQGTLELTFYIPCGDEILWNAEDIEVMTENVPICRMGRDAGLCFCCSNLQPFKKGDAENSSLIDGRKGIGDFGGDLAAPTKKRVSFGGEVPIATSKATEDDWVDRVLDWGTDMQTNLGSFADQTKAGFSSLQGRVKDLAKQRRASESQA
ncbi:MAG: hypothetical protein SGPRY_000976 [Prymnesium sp.]